MVKVEQLSLVLFVTAVQIYAQPLSSEAPSPLQKLTARIIVHIRKRRAEHWDFTQLNRNICPPSLCRAYDEKTGSTKPRPKGTGGSIFYQGDIVLDKRMGKFIFPEEKSGRRRKRATMKPRYRLWKNGVVIYKMSRAISPQAKRVIERAINHIQKRTCITFREKKDGDRDFIRFLSDEGCWSQIGRTGGVQLVSLGRGCENLGTAVHEIVHSLGVWHEQARTDRDKYVKILEDNISEKFLPDFAVVSKRLSTSRGYSYDYKSLMHYSKFAFTRNGEPTIKVIGIGEKLGLRIGQRRGLSTIDLSQLRDMYKCNLAKDENETVCHKGWTKHKTTCYKFFAAEKEQFGPASRKCGDLRATLLTIDTSRKQKHLDRYLARKFKDILTWRLGIKRINNYMAWYLGPDKHKNITSFQNWEADHPGSFTSAILRRNKDGQYKWVGEWAGSSSQRPNYQHSFICEKPARRKCQSGNYTDGRDYRGKMDHTRKGYTCQKWSENYPHNHTLVDKALAAAKTEDKEDEDGLGDHNLCRNPKDQRRNRPWCYTSKKRHKWDYCDISICSKSLKNNQRRLRRGQGKLKRRKGSRSQQKKGSSSSSTLNLKIPQTSSTSRSKSSRRKVQPYPRTERLRTHLNRGRSRPGRRKRKRTRRT